MGSSEKQRGTGTTHPLLGKYASRLRKEGAFAAPDAVRDGIDSIHPCIGHSPGLLSLRHV